MTLEKRGEMIEAMRKAAIENAEPLAKTRQRGNRYGRVADKIQKNLLVARRTPGIEDLSTYCKTGDKGMMLIEPGALRRYRVDYAVHQPDQHHHQYCYQHDRCG